VLSDPTLRTAFALLALISLSAPLATATAGHHAGSPASGSKAARRNAALSEGLVKKVDKGNQTVTLRHGELKDLNMPPMTMAYRVKAASMLGKVKAGDRVSFKATKVRGELILTQIAVKK
jgi:Cu/Ag efflux protein CusF